MDQVIQTPEQQHYLSKLLGYEYTIAYKPGKDNLVADALSRQSEPATAQFLGFSTPQFVFLDNLIKKNQSDPELATLHQQVINDPHSYSDLTIKDGLLFKNGKLLLSSTSPLRHSILHEFHSTPVGGHGGIYKTLKKISSNFVWPGLKADVESFVKSCEVCQQTKYVTSSPAGLLQPIPIPTKVWHDLAMDFITHLPSYKGNTTILVVVDRFSKAAHFGMLPSTYTAYSVAELFSTMICQLYGFPNSIISDRDPIFTSQFWQVLFKLNGTSLRMSSSYHPQTDGQTEVINRGLQQYLRCFVHDCPRRWGSYLHWADWCYNTTIHSSTGLTPYQAVYGRPPPTIPQYILGSSNLEAIDSDLATRDQILDLLKTNLIKTQTRMKKQADSHRKDVQFQEGELVYVKLQPYRQSSIAKRNSQKLSKRYYGPFPIEKKISAVAYKLSLPPSSRIHPIFHISLLKPCHTDS